MKVQPRVLTAMTDVPGAGFCIARRRKNQASTAELIARCPGQGRQRAVLIILTVIVLTVPLLVAVVVLVPELLIGPFLSGSHQRLIDELLHSLGKWNRGAPRAYAR